MIKLHWVTLNKTGAYLYWRISLGLVAEVGCFNIIPLGCVCMYSLNLKHKNINRQNVLTKYQSCKTGFRMLKFYCTSYIVTLILCADLSLHYSADCK